MMEFIVAVSVIIGLIYGFVAMHLGYKAKYTKGPLYIYNVDPIPNREEVVYPFWPFVKSNVREDLEDMHPLISFFAYALVYACITPVFLFVSFTLFVALALVVTFLYKFYIPILAVVIPLALYMWFMQRTVDKHIKKGQEL